MKTVLRKGMYETNSSSMHSVIINKDDIEFEQRNGDYPLSIKTDENYCRQEVRVLMSIEDKASFYMTLWCYTNGGNSDKKKGKNILLDSYYKEAERLSKVFFKRNYTFNFEEPKIEYDDFSKTWEFYIEQEGFYEFTGETNNLIEILKDDSILERFLIDKNTFVVIGGDEYQSAYDLTRLCALLLRNKNVDMYGSIDWYKDEV